MTGDVKRQGLIYLAAAIALTALVATGLPRLQLQPGLPLPGLTDGQVFVESTLPDRPVGMQVGLFFRILLLVVLSTFVAYLLYRLALGIRWRQALRQALPFLFALLALVAILSLAVVRLPQAEVKPASPSAELLPPPPLLAQAPLGPTPTILLWLVGLGLLCAVVLGCAWWFSRQRTVSASWQEEADSARQAILDGHDLKDVILQCYQRMSVALREGREIERETFMTAAEFERLLVAYGVPREPVHQLTRLFEGARYGDRESGASDEAAALQALDAILAYARAPRRGA